jgi:outer membrane lipoprotein-sorting protein
MSFFLDHPKARWAVPVAAVGVIGATALTINQSASADSGLPPRTAAQLLADVRTANVSSLSGTVVQTSDLGLPQIPGLPGAGSAGSASSSLTSLVSGSHTWRVWLDGPTRQRLALVGANGESDVIHNGDDLWLWSSVDKTAVHHKLAGDRGTTARRLPSGIASGLPGALPTGTPRSPDEAASAALAMIGKDTSVTTTGTASVAGRSVYELVLTPKDKATLVASVRIAIDSEKHVPMRVQVYSTKLANPAFEIGFTAVDFDKPDARQFAFTPPPGTTVTEGDSPDAPKGTPAPKGMPTPKGTSGTNAAPALPSGTAPRPTVVGSGWSTVVVAPFPTTALSTAPSQKDNSGAADDITRQLGSILKALPRTSGAWGSGHVLQGTLFSVLVTDDGRVALGAVAPDRLYAALAVK